MEMPLRTWIGGANVPTRRMRVNVGMPLAQLTLSGQRLELRFRPAFLTRLSRADHLSVTPRDTVCVYPCRSRRGFQGVGVSTSSGRDYYFKTWASREILSELREAGFPVSGDEREPTKIWTAIP